MSIYLYVKTHNKTGLKYLGKTNNKDPHKYPGSGKRWRNHLNKHGYDYETEILLITEDKEELKETGLYFSELWNVVDSDDWANLKPECGDGGACYWEGMEEHLKSIAGKGGAKGGKAPSWNKGKSYVRKKESIEKQRKALKGKRWWTNDEESIKSKECPGPGWKIGRIINFSEEGLKSLSEKGRERKYPDRTQTEESNLKRSESLKGRIFSEESNLKRSESLKGRIFSEEHRKNLSKTLSDGRLKGENNPGYGSKHMKGRKHYNDGKISIMAYECPPGFKPGRLKKPEN